MHAKSFANPLFRKMYFDGVLKHSAKDEALIEEAEGCIACHSPLTFLMNRGKINSIKEEHIKRLSERQLNYLAIRGGGK